MLAFIRSGVVFPPLRPWALAAVWGLRICGTLIKRYVVLAFYLGDASPCSAKRPWARHRSGPRPMYVSVRVCWGRYMCVITSLEALGGAYALLGLRHFWR